MSLRTVTVQNLTVDDLKRLRKVQRAAKTDNHGLLEVVRAGLDALEKPKKKAKKKAKVVKLDPKPEVLEDGLDLAFGD